MTIDTGATRIFPSLARVEKFLSVAETFCTMTAPPAQLWQVVLGHLASLERLVPHSRLRMGSLQWHLKTHWSPESNSSSLPVPLSQEVREDLSWWMVRDHLLKWVRFGTPAPDLHLYSVGVGRTPPRPGSVWGVVGAGEVAALQSFRNEGIVSGISVISGVGRRSPGDRDVQQLDGGGLRQQAGRDGFPFLLLVGQPASEVDGESRCPPRCQISSRAVQCSGRSPQPSGSCYRDRVVSPPSGGERPASSLGLAVDRPVRDKLQREASPVLFPCPESPGSLRGCIPSSLGQPGPLRTSTLSFGRKGVGSSQRDTQSLHDSGRPPLAREGVVRRPSPSADPTTSGASVVGPVVAAAPLQQVPQRCSASPPKVGLFARFCC